MVKMVKMYIVKVGYIALATISCSLSVTGPEYPYQCIFNICKPGPGDQKPKKTAMMNI